MAPKEELPTPDDVLDFYEEGEEDAEEEEEEEDEGGGGGEGIREGGVEGGGGGGDKGEGGGEGHDDRRGEPEPDIEGKTIIVCGCGPSLAQLFTELPNLNGDEVWATDDVGKLMKYDRLFYMEHPDNVADMSWVCRSEKTVYVCEARSDNMTEYPIREVVDTMGLLYINSSAAYAIALAICKRAAKLRLFGLDFDSDPGKRGCIEFLICKAVHSAVNIEIPSTSSLLGNNLSMSDRLFGFKDCDDKFVMGQKEGKRCLMRISELPDQYKVA